ncbi:MAG: transketolase [Candidatus Omnitrophota bacterium]|jgi:transketolase
MSLLDFRDAAFSAIYELAKVDSKVCALTNDMGAQGLDKLKNDFPKQVFNVGIAEQNMMSVASGLSSEGRTVFVYGIISHIIQRGFEQIKLDICCSNRSVVLLGIGSGFSYGGDGPTHHGNQDLALMGSLPGMTIYDPADAFTTEYAVKNAYQNKAPGYIRLDKQQHEALYTKDSNSFEQGCCYALPKGDINILASGILVHRAIEVANALNSKGLSVGVLDVFRLKPINTEVVDDVITTSKAIMVIEEHVPLGGLASLIEGRLARSLQNPLYIPIHPADVFYTGSANRAWVHGESGLLSEQLIESIEASCAKLA